MPQQTKDDGSMANSENKLKNDAITKRKSEEIEPVTMNMTEANANANHLAIEASSITMPMTRKYREPPLKKIRSLDLLSAASFLVEAKMESSRIQGIDKGKESTAVKMALDESSKIYTLHGGGNSQVQQRIELTSETSNCLNNGSNSDNKANENESKLPMAPPTTVDQAMKKDTPNQSVSEVDDSVKECVNSIVIKISESYPNDKGTVLNDGTPPRDAGESSMNCQRLPSTDETMKAKEIATTDLDAVNEENHDEVIKVIKSDQQTNVAPITVKDDTNHASKDINGINGASQSTMEVNNTKSGWNTNKSSNDNITQSESEVDKSVKESVDTKTKDASESSSKPESSANIDAPPSAINGEKQQQENAAQSIADETVKGDDKTTSGSSDEDQSDVTNKDSGTNISSDDANRIQRDDEGINGVSQSVMEMDKTKSEEKFINVWSDEIKDAITKDSDKSPNGDSDDVSKGINRSNEMSQTTMEVDIRESEENPANESNNHTRDDEGNNGVSQSVIEIDKTKSKEKATNLSSDETKDATTKDSDKSPNGDSDDVSQGGNGNNEMSQSAMEVDITKSEGNAVKESNNNATQSMLEADILVKESADAKMHDASESSTDDGPTNDGAPPSVADGEKEQKDNRQRLATDERAKLDETAIPRPSGESQSGIRAKGRETNASSDDADNTAQNDNGSNGVPQPAIETEDRKSDEKVVETPDNDAKYTTAKNSDKSSNDNSDDASKGIEGTNGVPQSAMEIEDMNANNNAIKASDMDTKDIITKESDGSSNSDTGDGPKGIDDINGLSQSIMEIDNTKSEENAAKSLDNNTKDATMTKEKQTAPKERKKKRGKKHLDPEMLEIRKRIQFGCRDNDLSAAMKAYDEAVENKIRVEAQSFYNLLNLCDGLERSVHIGTPKRRSSASDSNEESPAVDEVTRLQFAFRLRDHMKELSLPLNEAAYSAIVKLLSKSKEYDQAAKFLVEAEQVQQCKPKLRLYSSLLHAYCDAGRMLDALEIWKKLTKKGLHATEKEYATLMKCATTTGDSRVFERVLTDLAEDVLVPSKGTVSRILEWFELAHSFHKEALTKRLADEAMVNNCLAKIHECEKEKPPCMGPVVNVDGWNLGSACPVDTKTGVLQTGCLKGCKLGPMNITQRAWDEMRDMNEKIVTDGQIQGNKSKFQGGKKGKKRMDFSLEERRQQWRHFTDFLNSIGQVDVVIDGANVGKFAQNFSGAPRHVDYHQIDWIVQHFQKMGKKVLLVLHERHFARNMMPDKYRWLERDWLNDKSLYKTPRGMNDDWFWLHVAYTHQSLVITNDEMRDHHFQMLAPRTFLRWKERHHVHFDFGDWIVVGDRTGRQKKVLLTFPEAYSRRLQRVEDGLVIPLASVAIAIDSWMGPTQRVMMNQ